MLLKQALVEMIAVSIARHNGFFNQNTLAKKNHNPGRFSSWGNYPKIGETVMFPTDQKGWDALHGWIRRKILHGADLCHICNRDVYLAELIVHRVKDRTNTIIDWHQPLSNYIR